MRYLACGFVVGLVVGAVSLVGAQPPVNPYVPNLKSIIVIETDDPGAIVIRMGTGQIFYADRKTSEIVVHTGPGVNKTFTWAQIEAALAK